MSEENGTPSNNRVMLFLFLTTIMSLLILVVVYPLFVIKDSVPKLPEIPTSLESLIEWVTGILVSGGVLGKATTVYSRKQELTGAPTSTTSTTTTTTESQVNQGGTPNAQTAPEQTELTK